MLKRILAGSSLGGVAFALACSSNIPPDEVDGRPIVESATVSVKSFDASGAQTSVCSGTLLGPNLVLTAGHCAVGATRFDVSATKSGDSSAGKHAVTTDWKDFRSTLSRRGHTDAALIALDSEIRLSRYPTIVGDSVDGSVLHRIERGADGSVVSVDVPVIAGASKGFPHNYLGTYNGTSRDTGGAVYDTSGNIHGVVSGLGADSKMLHVAKVDVYSKWLTVAQKQCDPGDGSSSSSSGVVIRSGLGLLGWGSTSGSNTSSGWGSSGSNTSSGWGGTSGGYGGNGATIDAGSGGTSSSGTNASSSGSTSSSSSGSTTSSSSSGSTSSSGGGSTPGDSCIPNPSDNGGSTGSSSSGGSSGLPGASSSGGSSGSSSGGSSGNAPTSTPGQGSGPGGEEDLDECGGCELAPNCVDNVVDYGDSKSGGNSVGGTGPVIK